MVKDYDSLCKLLVQNNPQVFLHLFEPEAIFLHLLPEGLESVPGSQSEDAQRLDILMEAKIQALEMLVQIEWQTWNHRRMGERLLDYNRKVEEKHGQTPLSCVVYLLRDGREPTSPLIKMAGPFRVIHFDYRSVHAGNWLAEDLLARKDMDLLPLLPFTIGGLEILRAKKMLERLQQEGNELLLNIALAFVEYVFDHYHIDLSWLQQEREKMKPMRELPLFKEMLEEGRAEGREKGLEEGLEKGLERELARQRRLLLKTVKLRMPDLSDLAQEQAALINSPEVLSDLTLKLIAAKTVKQAERYLRDWSKPAKKRSV